MSESSPNFWSRRKAQVAAEANAEEQAELAVAQQELEAANEERSDEEILTELELPIPEDLQPGDDFSAFMKQAVPDRIRRRALRVLWRSNPVLANIDGLVDYGEDYTDAATVVENLQTSYQVGKGMLKHVLAEEEAKEKAAAALDADPVEEESSDNIDLDEDDAPVTETPPDEVLLASEAVLQDTPSDEPPVPCRRRMRFDFVEAPQTDEEIA